MLKEIKKTEYQGRYPKLAKKYSINAVQTWEGNTYNELLVNRTPENKLAAVAAIFPNSIDFYTGKKSTFIQFAGSTGIKKGAGTEIELGAELRAYEVGNNVIELTPATTAAPFWKGLGFEYRGKALQPRKQYEADISKNMIKHVPTAMWKESPPLKKMSAEEAKAYIEKRYPEEWKRKGYENKVHQMPTRIGKKGGTSSPDYILQMQPLELEQRPPQKPYKEPIQTITLNPLLDGNGRPTFVATRAEQAMIIRQYGLTPEEIKKAKRHNWSLNDLLQYREGEKAIREYDLNMMLSKDLLRKQLAKRPKQWTVMIPKLDNRALANRQPVTRKYKPGQIAKQEPIRTLFIGEEPPRRGLSEKNRPREDKLIFDVRGKTGVARTPFMLRDLDVFQKQKPITLNDRRFERVSLTDQNIFNIPDQMPRQYIEPIQYKIPGMVIPGLPVLPPFGGFFGGGGSSSGGGGGSRGKYPWREVIPLNWQLW
jgi:hypothetical protein